MKQKFIVEIEWNDEKPVSTDWFEKIIHDGMSDNGVIEWDGCLDEPDEEYGISPWDWEYKLISVKSLVDYSKITFDIQPNNLDKPQYEEVEYSGLLWDILYSVSEYKGGSLHCDEWIAEHEGKEYRLTECGSGANTIRSIAVRI